MLDGSVILCDSVISLLQLNSDGGFEKITSLSEGRERSETSDVKIIHLSLVPSERKPQTALSYSLSWTNMGLVQ